MTIGCKPLQMISELRKMMLKSTITNGIKVMDYGIRAYPQTRHGGLFHLMKECLYEGYESLFNPMKRRLQGGLYNCKFLLTL